MKKALISILILVLISSVSSGCGSYKGGKTVNMNAPAKTENIKPSDKTDRIAGNNISPAADTQMQNLSDEMDKLDSIMNGLDDSSDISDLEKIINNNF